MDREKKGISQHELANTDRHTRHKVWHIMNDLILLAKQHMAKMFKMLYDAKPFLAHYSATKTDTLHSRGEQLLFTSPEFTMCIMPFTVLCTCQQMNDLKKNLKALITTLSFF